MSFELLIPLGLLGLLGIAVLIIIYIIRPNYQMRHISSTYIWKLSLRYQKKRPPTSKIRNIILFLCQVLILTAMAGIMAWPALAEHANADGTDVVIVLDSSASMYAVNDDGETRFSRALTKLTERADTVIDNGGRVSVIVASDNPYYLARRADSTQKMRLRDEIDALRQSGSSYAVADLDGAMELSREIINENAATELYLITDTPYEKKPERVNIELVRDEAEWNAAILDVTAVKEEGYYVVTAQVVSYGVSTNIEVSVTVEGAKRSSSSESGDAPLEFVKEISCDSDSVKTVIFRSDNGKEIEDDDNIYYRYLDVNERFTTFTSIRVGLDVDDSYEIDDAFYVYGGKKDTLRVQYYSSDPNPFVNSSLDIAKNALVGRYELDIREVKKGFEPELEGFDVYVFEHAMPKELPTDGVILMLDPDPYYGEIPADAGFAVSEYGSFDELTPLGEGVDYQGHPIVKNLLLGPVDEGGLAVTRYDVISDYNENYQVLLSCEGNPVLMVQDNDKTKIAVMAFSVHNSNLPALPENFLLMYNIFDYFFPAIVSGNSFNVNEEFVINTWGKDLTFSGNETTYNANELPMNYSIAVPGRYSFNMTTYYDRNISVDVYVKPPADESNIRVIGIGITDPYDGADIETVYRDLLIFLAAALVALLFLEWILHARDNK